MRRQVPPALLLAAALLTPAVAVAVPRPAPAAADAAIRLAQSAPAAIVLEDGVRDRQIVTDAGQRMQVLFADGTAITLAANSEMTVTAFAFDPAAGTARLSATLARGTFRFIGGRTARTPDGVSLATPFGAIAIDRGSADISLGGEGTPPHFDLVFGKGMTLSQGGRVTRVRKPGYSIAPAPGGGSASIRKTPAEWRSATLQALP